MAFQILAEINAALCNGCGRCVQACAAGALAISGGQAVLARPDLCQWDATCELACPSGAIKVPFVIVFGEDLRDNPCE